VDGFCPDKGASNGNEGGEVLCGFLAAQGDSLEALELADGLLDTGAGSVESTRKVFGLGRNILTIRDNGTDAASARGFAVRLAVVALVADHCPGRDVRADVEQNLETAAVTGLAAGQMEGQG